MRKDRQTDRHTHTHTHRHNTAKMAAEEKQGVNDALETLVSITEKSGNLRKDLKNDIHVSVSTSRKAFSHLIHQLDYMKEEYNRYREEVKNATKSDVMGGLSQPTRLVAPSLDHTHNNHRALVHGR